MLQYRDEALIPRSIFLHHNSKAGSNVLSNNAQVYGNGSVYSPEVLDITEDTLHQRFLEGMRNIASVCLQIGYPTGLYPPLYKVKVFLGDSSAFTVAAPAVETAAHATKKEEVKKESEASDDDMGFGLFK
ncbi:UNVERIFIED_CONTAM: hypothetical protein FKN15_043451 [Acipenser sinensis]